MTEGSRGLRSAQRDDTPRTARATTRPRRGRRKRAGAMFWHPSGAPPGCGTVAPWTGGVAALNPRLISGKPPACGWSVACPRRRRARGGSSVISQLIKLLSPEVGRAHILVLLETYLPFIE